MRTGFQGSYAPFFDAKSAALRREGYGMKAPNPEGQ